MGYQGSNYDAGTVAVESGTIAGPGSYVALNSDGEMVLTTSTAGGGGGSARSVAGDTDNGLITWVTSDNTFAAESTITYDSNILATEAGTISASVGIFTAGITSSAAILATGTIGTELGTVSGSKGIFTAGLTSSAEIIATGNIRTALGTISGTTLVASGEVKTQYGTVSGSKGIFTAGLTSSAEILASGNIRTELGTVSGTTLVASGEVKTQYGTVSGSKGIFTAGLTSSAEIIATGNIRTELGDFSGSGVVVSKDVQAQYGTVSGSKGIFTAGLTSSAEIIATGNIRTELGTISGTTLVASGDIKTQYASISGSQVIASNGGTAIAAQYGTISGSKGIFVTGLTSSAEILATGNVRTELGDFSGSGVVVSKDVQAQYGTISGSKGIFVTGLTSSAEILATGNVRTELGDFSGSGVVVSKDVQAQYGTISGSQGIFTKDAQMASDLYVSGALQSNQATLLGAGLTTTSALAISADDTLTSGQAISIDLNDAATTSVTPAGLRVDFDKDGVMGAGQMATYQGVHVVMDDAATNHANAIVFKKGVGVELKNDVSQGSTVNIGFDVSASAGLSNIGLRTCTDDTHTNSVDIMMSSSINVNDYGTIKVGEHGTMTIATVDQSHALANIEIEADGDIEMETAAGGKFELQTHTANGAGTGWNTAGMVESTVANINGEIVTTLLVDIQGTRGHNGTNGNDGRVIGRDGQSNAYLTRVQNAINGYVYKVEISCIEEPDAASGVLKNIVLSADGSAAAQGADGSGYDHLADLNGNWARGTSKSSADGATFGNGLDDDYLYLTNGSTGGDDNDYTAGKFIIKLYGASFAGQG